MLLAGALLPKSFLPIGKDEVLDLVLNSQGADIRRKGKVPSGRVVQKAAAMSTTVLLCISFSGDQLMSRVGTVSLSSDMLALRSIKVHSHCRNPITNIQVVFKHIVWGLISQQFANCPPGHTYVYAFVE